MSEEVFNRNKYKFSLKRSIRTVENQSDIKKKKEAISFLNKELRLYKISLKNLYSDIPTDNVRNVLFNIAYYIVQDEDLLESFFRKRDLPYRAIIKKTLESKSFIERWSEYITLYTVMLSRPDYKTIQDYVEVSIVEEKQKLAIVPMKDEKKMITGIALVKNKKSTVVITSDGKIEKIKQCDSNIGYEVTGIKSRGLKYYRKYIVLAASIMVIVALAFTTFYKSVSSTVIVSSTSDFKVEINRFSRVINVSSETKRGQRVVNNLDYSDSSVDDILNNLVSDIIKNDMIPQSPNKLLILVNGKSLDDKDFALMENTIREKNIKAQINNSGVQKQIIYETEGKEKN